MAYDNKKVDISVNLNTNADQASNQIDKFNDSLDTNISKLKDAKEATKELDKEIEKQDKATKDLTKSIGDNSTVTNLLDKATNGLYSTYKDTWSSIKDGISNVREYISTQRASTVATNTSSVALRAFKVALATTGIGALIVGLGMAIEYFTKLSDATERNAKLQENYDKDLLKRSEETADKLNAIENDYAFKINNLARLVADKKITEEQRVTKEKELELQKQLDLNKLYDNKTNSSLEEYQKERLQIIKKNNEEINKLNTFGNNVGFIQGNENSKSLTVNGGDLKSSANYDDNNALPFLTNQGKQNSTVEKIFKSQISKAYEDLIELDKRYSSELKENRQTNMQSAIDLEKSLIDLRLQEQADGEQKRLKAIEDANNQALREHELYTLYYLNTEQKFQADLIQIEKNRIDDLDKNKALLDPSAIKEANKQTNEYANNMKSKLLEAETLYLEFVSLTDEATSAMVNSVVDGTKSFEEAFGKYTSIIGQGYEGVDEKINELQIKISARQELMANNPVNSILDTEFNYMGTKEQLDKLLSDKISFVEEEYQTELNRLQLLDGTLAEELQLYQSFEDRKSEIMRSASDTRKDIEQREFDFKMQLGYDFASILGTLSDASKEGTGIQKGLAIASVGLETAVASISAFRANVQAFPAPFGQIAGAVASTAIALQGLNQINQMKKIRTDGTETGGGGAVSAMAQPNVSFVSSDTNQIKESIDKASEQERATPIKAYVVASDVTTQQQMDRVIKESSSM